MDVFYLLIDDDSNFIQFHNGYNLMIFDELSNDNEII
jgi:uncharacterized membrane protein